MRAAHIFCLVIVLGVLSQLCLSDPVYRRFSNSNKVLTVKTGGSPPYAVVWEDARQNDTAQQFRVADGYIYCRAFEPAEIVLDVKGLGTAAGTDVIAFTKKPVVASNQQWILTDVVESELRTGFFLSQLTVGAVTKAVMDYTRVTVKAEDVIVDYVFCIDTTGSMGGDINAVKLNAVTITNMLYSAGVDARIAVMDYRDFNSRTYYSPDYPYDVKKSFSKVQADVINGINALSLGYGGDLPESGYSCIMAALTGQAGPWRATAEKYIMVLTDANALDPEPITGYTRASVTAATSDFSLISITTDRLYTRAAPRAAPAYPPVKIYATVVRADYVTDFWSPLTTATKGETYYATDSSKVAALLKDAISAITAPAVAARTSQLALSLTATSTTLKPTDRLEVAAVLQNTGSVDALAAQVVVSWPCLKNVVVGFPSAPFQFQADATTGLITITLAKGVKAGSTITFRISSDAICSNATTGSIVGVAKDTVASITTDPVTLSLSFTSGICSAPLSQCGAGCYNPAQYNCIGGILYSSNVRSCGVATYDINAYDCYDNTLCPKGLLLCGAAHCYSSSEYVCINSVKLCPMSAPYNCDDACFNPSTTECCNNLVANKLCPLGSGCGC